jgi:hypothetical protein
LSTLALEPASGAHGGRFAPIARSADLILLAIALPVFLVANLPVEGYLAVAAAWIAQRAVQHWAGARVAQASERTSALRLIAGTFMARLWLITIAILLVGVLGDDEAGLSAAVLAAALVTANLAGEALTRQPAEESEKR